MRKNTSKKRRENIRCVVAKESYPAKVSQVHPTAALIHMHMKQKGTLSRLCTLTWCLSTRPPCPPPEALLGFSWALKREPIRPSSHVPSNVKSTHDSWTSDSPRNLIASLGLESKESIAVATIHEQVAGGLLDCAKERPEGIIN